MFIINRNKGCSIMMHIYRLSSWTVFCMLGLLLVVVSGCSTWGKNWTFKDKSDWHKGDIWLVGTNYKCLDGPYREYVRIYIGTPCVRAKQLPPIYVEQCEGRKVLLSLLSVDDLEELGPVEKVSFISGPPLSIECHRWPHNYEYYDIRCPEAGPLNLAFSFAVTDGNIVAVIIYGHGGCTTIWNRDLTKRYEFPLTYDEVVELFGEPDEVIEYFAK